MDQHHIDETRLITRRSARDQILLAWDHACAYCRTPLNGKKATLDHVVPKAKGGLTVRENLVPACLSCNAAKQHHEWLAWFRSQPFHTGAGEQAIRAWLNA